MLLILTLAITNHDQFYIADARIRIKMPITYGKSKSNNNHTKKYSILRYK